MKRKIIKWTLAISETDEDDICLPFATSVDRDTYGNSEAVNVVDIAVVFKLVEALKKAELIMFQCMDRPDMCPSPKQVDEVGKALKLADIIMDESKDKLEEKA